MSLAPPPPELPTHVRIHDASRVEWVMSVPLPARGRRTYSIRVELEVPTNAVAEQNPWAQLQTFTRLDCASGTYCSPSDASTDTLRRGTIGLTRTLRVARLGFERHCQAVAADATLVAGPDGEHFLTDWFEAALRAARETRLKLTQPTALDTPLAVRERQLIDEFVSVRLLETIADADRLLNDENAEKGAPEKVARARANARETVERALHEEIDYRRARGFLEVGAASPMTLERYVARTARLKKHFEEVLFLDRETRLVDESVGRWITVVAAVVAGTAAFAIQLSLSSATHVGVGLIVLAVLAGAAYALRDRIKEFVRAWLTGKVYRYHSQRTSRWRLPERREVTRAVVARAREWCNQTTRTDPDPLNPESGASLTTTLVQYVHQGVVYGLPGEVQAGATHVRHIFRYNLATLFPRLHDEVKRVPVIESDDRVRFVDAPRRYRIPISLDARIDDETWPSQVTLVLDKRGLDRIETEPEPDEPGNNLTARASGL